MFSEREINMNFRILFVEDDKDLQLAVSAYLLQDNPQIVVETVGGVKRANLYVTTRGYDLIVLDLGLPDGSGFEVLDHVRAGKGLTPADAPVVIYSALGPASVAPIAEIKGADAYFPKSPLGIRQLRHWVTKSIYNARKRARSAGGAS